MSYPHISISEMVDRNFFQSYEEAPDTLLGEDSSDFEEKEKEPGII